MSAESRVVSLVTQYGTAAVVVVMVLWVCLFAWDYLDRTMFGFMDVDEEDEDGGRD